MFRLVDYRRFLHEHRAAIDVFQSTRRRAFDAERDEWTRRNELSREATLAESSPEQDSVAVPAGAEIVEAPLGGSVWKINVRLGDRIEKGTVIAAIEAMKTECSVPSPAAGIVRAIYIQERQSIAPGMPVIALESCTHTPGS